MYYTYIIQCKDSSFYTGITTNNDRRITEHKNKTKRCAKYTYTHDIDKLVALWQSENRSTASKLEYQIKKLNKKDKIKLIKENQFDLLPMLDKTSYKRITDGNNHYIDVHINRLRRRFENNPDFKIITVRGLGYKVIKNEK